MSRDTLIISENKKLELCKCPYCKTKGNLFLRNGFTIIVCDKCNSKFDFEYDKPRKIRL